MVVDLTDEVVRYMRKMTNVFARETNALLDRPYMPSEALAKQVGFTVEPVYPDPPREVVGEPTDRHSG